MTIAAIKGVLAADPELTYAGFGLAAGGYADRRAAIQAERDRMLTPEALEQFARAVEWLEDQPRTQNINRRAGTSAGFKDEAGPDGAYIGNGMFIAAAIACGYKVERAEVSVNAWLNMSVLRPTNPNRDFVGPARGPRRR